MSEPEAVLVALEELGAARCPLPVHAGLIQPLAAALALGARGTAASGGGCSTAVIATRWPVTDRTGLRPSARTVAGACPATRAT